MAFRIDSTGSLRPPRFTADGRLRADALLTRTGVFSYRQPDGTIQREYRPASEVFDPESLASFEALPITDDHPPDMLDDATRTQYARGSTGENVVKADDGRHVKSSIVVFDAALVAKMRAGKSEVSNGYKCDLDKTPGTSPEGEPYDVVQRKIRGNHVAIVERGRAGTARVRMDAAIQVDDINSERPERRADHTEIITMDELKKALEEAAAQKARADQAIKDRDAQEARAVRAETERDATKQKLDAAESQARTDAAEAATALETAKKQAREDAVARVDVEAKARTVLGSDKDGKARKFDGVETRAIKLEVIQAVLKRDSSKESDAHVDVRFDVAVEQFGAGQAGAAGTREAGGSEQHARGDAGDREQVASRKYDDHLKNAYKQKGQ